jgi:glycerol-3-phosphate dehydrogenase subunit C
LINSDSARTVSAAVVELMEYLNALENEGRFDIEKLRTKNYQLRTKIYYHAPCHMKSFHGAKFTPDLFAKLDVQVQDLNGGCCGLAGTTGMQKKNRDLCDAIGQPLKELIEKAAPNYILTECAACKMQIEHLTGKSVLHPIMLLDELIPSARK